MAGTEAFEFFVVVPIVAWAIELLVIRGAYEEATRDLSSHGVPARPGRMYVLLAYGAFPVATGLFLWFLSKPLTDQLDASTGAAASSLQALLIWAAIAYGAVAITTMAARVVVLRVRFAGVLGQDFGRVLPIWVIPFTGTVFALVLAFLVFGALDNALAGYAVPSSSDANTAVVALQIYAVTTLGYLVGSLLSNRVKDLSASGFGRALTFAVPCELPAVLGLVWAFLAIGAL